MKKIIAIIAVVAAAFTASADYLYWMLDDTNADSFTASLGKTYNTMKLQAIDDSGAVVHTFASGSPTSVEFEFGGVTDLSGYAMNDSMSFLVELYNGSDWVAQSKALAWGEAGKYIGGSSAMSPVSSSAWSASGFNVPEPTSGLLMLLGGMLLALKRRKTE